MKLTYWVASHPEPRLSIRSKTRWEARCGVGDAEDEYGPVAKVEVYYGNAFELMIQCMDGDSHIDGSLTGTGPGDVLAAELKASPPPAIGLDERRFSYAQALELAQNGQLIARAFWPWNHLQASLVHGSDVLYWRDGPVYQPSDEDRAAKDWEVRLTPRPSDPPERDQ